VEKYRASENHNVDDYSKDDSSTEDEYSTEDDYSKDDSSTEDESARGKHQVNEDEYYGTQANVTNITRHNEYTQEELLLTPTKTNEKPTGLEIGGVTCEVIKTSRSSCGKCGEKILCGKPRVGIPAWIFGRKVFAWQCSFCFLGNVVCGYDSGRTRCKLTDEAFRRGELKIGLRSHNATMFYKVYAVGKILQAVCRCLEEEEQRELAKNVHRICRVEGLDDIVEKDRVRIRIMLNKMVYDLEKSPQSL